MEKIEQIDMRRPPYRGIITEVAKLLKKRHSATYHAIFYSDAANKDKELFVKLKKEREAKLEAFRDSLVNKAV